MWWILVAFAEVPAPDVAEEIIVYADPLSPWDETRWWMVAEVRSPEPLVLEVGGESVPTVQWQIEAQVTCRIQKRRAVGGIVGCAPEVVSIRVATEDHWQRPEDRRRVQQVLDRITSDVESSEVGLRVRNAGDLAVRSDQREQAATQGAALLKTLYHAFDLQLPSTGFRDGAVWTTTDVPLFDAHFGLERKEEGVHYGNLYKGEALIQSTARAQREFLLPVSEVTSNALKAPWFHSPSFLTSSSPVEITVTEFVNLDGVAIVDLEQGFVTERVWAVRAETTDFYAAGRFRQLGADEEIGMPPSGQVSPPTVLRPGLPRWKSIDEPSVGVAASPTP